MDELLDKGLTFKITKNKAKKLMNDNTVSIKIKQQKHTKHNQVRKRNAKH